HTSASAVYTLSLHDALPIFARCQEEGRGGTRNAFHRAVDCHPVLLYTGQTLLMAGSQSQPGFPVVSVVIPSHNRARFLSETLDRSEEHTSELQSRFDLVCRL